MLSLLKSHVRRFESVTTKAVVALLGLVFALAILITRVSGLGPRVMGDELTYSTYSRLLPISDSPVPNYLYLWIFSSTNFCGTEFYTCARLLNIWFVVLTALFVFLIARKILGYGPSLFLALASIAGPTSMYAAHFMPDSMFVAASVFFVWLLLRLTESKPSLRTLFALGLAVGVISLIKPHGLFLLASIPAVSTLFANSFRDRVRVAFIATVLSGAGAFLVKLGVGFIVAGQNGLVLFRSAYGTFVPAVQASGESAETDSVDFLQNLFGQFETLILALAVLFLVPIAATLSQVRKLEDGSENGIRRLSLTLAVLQVAFLVPVAVFVAQLIPIDPSQSFRAQLRYFEFLLLLYPIAALGFLKSKHRKNSILGWIALTAVAVLGVFWWLKYEQEFVHVYSDATYLPMLARAGEWGTPVALFALTLALIFGINRDWAIRGWAYGLLPVMVLISVPAMYFDESIRSDTKPAHVVAAEFTVGTLGPEDLNQLIVVGGNRQEADAARFIIGNPNVKRKVVDDLGAFFVESLPIKFGWVLVLGQQSMRGYPLQVYEGNGFHLLRRDSGNISFFNLKEPGRAVIDFLNIEDLGSLGAWTIGDLSAVRLLDSPLSGSRIKIRLEATRGLLGSEIVFRLGGESISVPVEVTGEPFLVDLGFDNPDFARELFIELPPGSTEVGQQAGLNLTYLELSR
jgi:phosphoglycerol transferase